MLIIIKLELFYVIGKKAPALNVKRLQKCMNAPLSDYGLNLLYDFE